MKVYVVYENSGERQAAANLAQVCNGAGHLLGNAQVIPGENGVNLKISAGPAWQVTATVHDDKDVRVKSKLTPPTPKSGRDLIFEEE